MTKPNRSGNKVLAYLGGCALLLLGLIVLPLPLPFGLLLMALGLRWLAIHDRRVAHCIRRQRHALSRLRRLGRSSNKKS